MTRPNMIFFFFSSRRRHTRSLCDWSSDVCSSDLPRRGGVWDPRNRGLWQNPDNVQQARDQLSEASRDLLTLGSRLRDQGVSEEELKAIRELGEALRAGLGGNPDLLPSEFQKLVNLADQLELKLTANSDGERASVRTQAPPQIAEGFEDAVAEYFR